MLPGISGVKSHREKGILSLEYWSEILGEDDGGCWGIGADGISSAGSAVDMLSPRVHRP